MLQDFSEFCGLTGQESIGLPSSTGAALWEQFDAAAQQVCSLYRNSLLSAGCKLGVADTDV
eukprot:1162045-Pelagomonas_calceolata.AAC.2